MQFSLFGAEAGELALPDLDGVLLGGGHWLASGDAARLSVVVPDAWRADALTEAFATLGVPDAAGSAPVVTGTGPRSDAVTGAETAIETGTATETSPPPTSATDPHPTVAGAGGHLARTAMTPSLRAMELRWRRGAIEAPPDDLVLSAAGLRLWAITAGVGDDVGYLLGTPGPDGPSGRLHRVAGALLARTGIAAVELGVRGGPGWRVTSARRLRRLAELIGAPPPGAEAAWPRVPTGGPGRV